MARPAYSLKMWLTGLTIFAASFAAQAQVFNISTQFPPIVSACSFQNAVPGSYTSLTNQFIYGPAYQATISHVNGYMSQPFSVLAGGADTWSGYLYSTNGPIQFKFQSIQRRFGGYFMPHAPLPAQRPTKVVMVFLKGNQQVGNPTVTTLAPTGWTWAGFDLGVGGFDTVAIFSNSTLKHSCLRMDRFFVTKS